MAVIVNIQFEIAAGKREEALGIININLPDTRSYEGCHWVHLVTPIDDENRVEALSMWDSKEAYERMEKNAAGRGDAAKKGSSAAAGAIDSLQP